MRTKIPSCVATIVRIINDIKKKGNDIHKFGPRFSALVTVVVHELIIGSRLNKFSCSLNVGSVRAVTTVHYQAKEVKLEVIRLSIL